MYRAVLITPDGQDYVTDFHNSKSINDVWEAVNNMGSRWYFYPIVFVTPDNNTKVKNNRISDTPDTYRAIRDLKGKTINQAMRFIADNQDLIDIMLN